MKRLERDIVVMAPLPLLASGFALAADDSKVKAGTRQVENGAKEDSREQGRGRPEGNGQRVGKTVSEGAKYSWKKVKEAVK